MRMRKRQSITTKKKHLAGKAFLFISVLLLLVLALAMNASLKPLIKTLAIGRAESIATIAINDAVTAVLKDKQIEYSDLVDISYNADGLVTSIKVNSVEANQLKADLSNAIADSLYHMDRKQITIPLGTMTGIDFLAGRGPSVKLYINLTGSASTDLVSEFSTAGINQVCHQIDLRVDTSLYIIMAGQNTSTQITSDIVIAETVIVGSIPEIYAGANDELWPNLVE